VVLVETSSLSPCGARLAEVHPRFGKQMSLEQIAEKLNAEKVPTIHGTNRWTAASVRNAFVS
jgi:hypothetical protein